MDALRVVLAGGLVLGVMVLLHEWGHFIAAKLCGVRVDVFSIGFGPRIWGFKRGDTDYRISVVPLGGYVRMAGDNPIEERTGASYEFLSRPRWQRCIIAVAGPAMNVFLTFAILWGIYWFVGMPVDRYLSQPPDVAAIPLNIQPEDGNVLPGDRILSVNGTSTPTWESVLSAAALAKPGSSLAIAVRRAGSTLKLTVPVPANPGSTDSIVGYPALPAVADEIAIGFPAERAGMKPDDTIIAINGHPVVSWMQLTDQVRDSDGRPVHFLVRRNGRDVPIDITPVRTMDADGEMAWAVGIQRKTEETYEPQGLLQSIEDSGAATLSSTREIGQFLGGFSAGKFPYAICSRSSRSPANRNALPSVAPCAFSS